MIPDLGRHAGAVLGAYAVTLVLLGLLVLTSWRRAARMRDALSRVEREVKGSRHGQA